MSRRPERGIYAIGFALCALGGLGTLFALPHLPAGAATPDATRQIGYTFSGLTLLLAVLSYGWLRREQQHRAASLIHGGLYLASCAFALALWKIGGAHPETARYARIFALLPPIMFFALVPRPEAR